MTYYCNNKIKTILITISLIKYCDAIHYGFYDIYILKLRKQFTKKPIEHAIMLLTDVKIIQGLKIHSK